MLIKFNKKELKNKFNATDEQVNLIIKYQNKIIIDIPELKNNSSFYLNKEIFPINAKYLYRELNVGEDFDTWRRNMIKFYNLKENESFIILSTEYFFNFSASKIISQCHKDSTLGSTIETFLELIVTFIQEKIQWDSSRKASRSGYKDTISYFENYSKLLLNWNNDEKEYHPYMGDFINILA